MIDGNNKAFYIKIKEQNINEKINRNLVVKYRDLTWMNRVVIIDRDSFSIPENIRCAILGETVFHKSALVPKNK